MRPLIVPLAVMLALAGSPASMSCSEAFQVKKLQAVHSDLRFCRPGAELSGVQGYTLKDLQFIVAFSEVSQWGHCKRQTCHCKDSSSATALEQCTCAVRMSHVVLSRLRRCTCTVPLFCSNLRGGTCGTWCTPCAPAFMARSWSRCRSCRCAMRSSRYTSKHELLCSLIAARLTVATFLGANGKTDTCAALSCAKCNHSG